MLFEEILEQFKKALKSSKSCLEIEIFV